jgi:SAM-dependent methyltransferase
MTARVLAESLRGLTLGSGKVFLEAGAGTSESSVLVDFSKHIWFSLDISDAALRRNVNPQFKLQADMFNLPFRNNSVDVIFNVGVHEHYDETQNATIFEGFYRVLKPGGRVVVCWPWYWAPLMFLGRAINVTVSAVTGRKYELYPNQNWELRHFFSAHDLLSRAGFVHVRHHLSFFDLFSCMVLEFEKSPAHLYGINEQWIQ